MRQRLVYGNNIWLVGQGHPPEKYEFVNWDDQQPNIHGKIKLMATKPPRDQEVVDDLGMIPYVVVAPERTSRFDLKNTELTLG